MADWKPPKIGSPIWMSISASDVARGRPKNPWGNTTDFPNEDPAYKFYSTVLGWYFKPGNEAFPESKGRRFEFSPDVGLSGGILLVPDEIGVLETGHGGTTMFWHVEDLEKTSEEIVSAGGKMLSGTQPESGFGEYRYFEDTEGNLGGVYQIIKKD